MVVCSFEDCDSFHQLAADVLGANSSSGGGWGYRVRRRHVQGIPNQWQTCTLRTSATSSA